VKLDENGCASLKEQHELQGVGEQGTETGVWATGDNYIMGSFTICTPHQIIIG